MRDENEEVFIDAAALRETPTTDLELLIPEVQQKLLELRSQAVLRPPDNSHLFKGLKKLIARAKTILRERQNR